MFFIINLMLQIYEKRSDVIRPYTFSKRNCLCEYAFLPQGVKWVLCVFMLLGRVELFTLITVFSRNIWKITR